MMQQLRCVICFLFWQLEEAAKEVADEVTRPRPVGEEAVQDIQVMLKSDAHHASIRSLKVPPRLSPCVSPPLQVWSTDLCCAPFLFLSSLTRCRAWLRCMASSSQPRQWRPRPQRCVCSVAAAVPSSPTSPCRQAWRATLCRANATSEWDCRGSSMEIMYHGIFTADKIIIFDMLWIDLNYSYTVLLYLLILEHGQSNLMLIHLFKGPVYDIWLGLWFLY